RLRILDPASQLLWRILRRTCPDPPARAEPRQVGTKRPHGSHRPIDRMARHTTATDEGVVASLLDRTGLRDRIRRRLHPRHPLLELLFRLRDHTHLHECVRDTAELRALAQVLAWLLDRED